LQAFFEFINLSVRCFEFLKHGKIVLLTREHVESNVKVADDKAEANHKDHEKGGCAKSSPKHIASMV